MANLTNKKIKDTYEGLIKTNDNAAISGEVELTDGLGNGTGVSVSTDGRVVAEGIVSFGSLKDTGEDITITKFVDEADGIANNDNDTSIPTTAAVKDYVDSTELNSVTSVNTQTGDVVLDTDDVSEGSSNLYYTEARVSANTSVAANTAKNSYPSADATKLAGIETGAEVNTVDSVNTQTGAVVLDTDDVSEGSTNLYYTEARVSANTDVTANTAKNSYPTADATKLAGIEAGAQVNTVDSVNAQTGAVVLDADDIDDTSTTNKWSTTAEKTKLGYISVTQAVDLDSIEQKQNSQFKAIGLATDFGFRVLSDSGKVEGTQCIMENMEILILN